MEDEKRERLTGEIEEAHESEQSSTPKHVRTNLPEVEIQLYRQGKGPIDVFKATLGGWDQDQVEVRDICEKYGFKTLYAFNPESGRGVPIRFHPRNGRSLQGYRNGSVIYFDGEPKDPLIKPVTKILFGVALTTVLITLAIKDPPTWMKKLNLSSGSVPPWVLACMVIVFTRMRKRTRDLFKKYG